jgi:hypothetical protein
MPLSRRRFACLALPVLAAGCGSPEPALYTIQMKPGAVLPRGPRVVQLRDIGLPGYLDRREIVRSAADYKLGVLSNDWWGESLASMLSRVIIIGLSQRLPDSRVYPEGGAISADPNAVLGVNIQRMDLDGAGTLDLIAQAAVEFNRPARSASNVFHIVRPPGNRSVAAQVAAISDAIAELTDGLATLLAS